MAQEESLYKIIANSPTIPQLPEATNIFDDDYVVLYSAALQKAVKIKKSNVQFPTTSFVTGETINDFPPTGVTSSLYLENSTNKLYKWNGVNYQWLDSESAVENQIVSGVIDKAPSQDAVFDALALKVDKVEGKELSSNDYTDLEKAKLAGLESAKFKGTYVSLAALQSAFPTSEEGSYAHVDGGVGNDVQIYIFDFDDSQWVLQGGGTTSETAASIKTKYESNPDTNAFTDTNKTQLADSVAHGTRTDNPHQVTASQVGLGNVNNTSDVDKPLSNGAILALQSKANDSEVLHNTGNETKTGILSVEQSGLAGTTSLLGKYIRLEVESDDQIDHPILEVWRSRVANWLMNGDEIGALAFRGKPPYSNGAGAGLNAFADEDWNSAAEGTELRVFTTENGTNIKRTHAVFQSSGKTAFGNNVMIGSFLSPFYPLEVVSEGVGIVHMNSLRELRVYTSLVNDHSKLIMNNGSDVNRIVLNTFGTSYFNGGNIAIGKTTASVKLDVVGGGRFTEALEVPIATLDTHAVNLGQVREEVAAVKEHQINGTRLTANITGTFNFDWNAYSQFVLTPTGAVTLGNDNLPVAPNTKEISGIIKAGSVATLPDNWVKRIDSDSYDNTKDNYFEAKVIADNTVSYTIKNKAVGSGTSTGGGEVLYNVETYGAVHDGVTDDTVAIQTAINAAFADGGGVVYFPKGIYIIAGALQTSVGEYGVNPNSQIWIPYYNADIQDRRTIELRGEVTSTLFQGLGIESRPAANSGVILRSTIQGSGTSPAVITNMGGAPNDSLGISRTNLMVKNISVQVTVNANNKVTMGGIDCYYSSIANFEYVTVFPHTIALQSTTEPNLIDVTGIAMPKVAAEHINTLRNVTVGGFTNGYKYGEHTSAYDVIAVCCINGFVGMGNNHSANLHKISTFWCKNDLAFSGNTKVNIGVLLVEWKNAGYWFDNVYTIYDPSNFGIGKLSFDVVEANVGLNNEKFKRLGGGNISTTPISVDLLEDISTAAYTLKYADAHRKNRTTSASDQTITIPSEVTYDRNAEIVIQRLGAGNVTIVPATGVTLNMPSGYQAKILSQYDAISLVKTGSNSWGIYGALTPVA